jgi:hypothetical protein
VTQPEYEWGEGPDDEHVIKRYSEQAARQMVQHRHDYDNESYLYKRLPDQPWERVNEPSEIGSSTGTKPRLSDR